MVEFALWYPHVGLIYIGEVNNLLRRAEGIDMGDGWETARNPNRPRIFERGTDGELVMPGWDWCTISLACRGRIVKYVFIRLTNHQTQKK